MESLKRIQNEKKSLVKTGFLLIGLVAAILMLQIGVAVAEQDKGEASMVLEGGAMGDIAFPHGKHQVDPKVCTPCHALFPQESKAIVTMKSEGKLKKKEVMDVCRGCHKELEAKGEMAGPTDCKGCHKK